MTDPYMNTEARHTGKRVRQDKHFILNKCCKDRHISFKKEIILDYENRMKM